MTCTVKKNETYTVTISGTGEKGEGIGRIDNFAVFVPYALLGETVEILIVKVQKNYAYGKILKIISPSKHRKLPQCPSFFKCGGCDFWHCSYEYELQYKTDKVRDCIKRIGGIDVTVNDTKGSTNLHYRNKSQFPVTEDGIGFYAQRSHRVVQVENCLIQDEKSNRAAKIVESFMRDFHVKPYNEQTKKGVIRHIYTRCTKTGTLMVCIVATSKDIKNIDSLLSMLKKEFSDNISVILNINNKNTNVILGEKNIVLWGDEVITDKIGELYFEISPHSFFQINSYQTKTLYDEVVKLADFNGTENVLDLYCGIGTISLYIAKYVNKVVGIECVEPAVINAKKNAKLNNIKNAEFYVGKSEDIADKFPESDVIIVDPPRKGCDNKLLKTIDDISPKKLIYVSCNPSTLARDMKILEEYGFETKHVQPIDMFPKTSHVECVCILKRKQTL